MQIGANSIRQGNILRHLDKLWIVAKQPMHTKPGKGGAFIQVELKDVVSGTKLNERFRSSENVEKIRLDQVDYQYLYHDDSNITVMNTENYEQIDLSTDLLGADKLPFLMEGTILVVEFYEDKPILVHLPEQVTATVIDAEPVIKGQTATASYKPAMLDIGVRVMVPPFITPGEKIIVRTDDSSYVERAKEAK